MDADFVRVIGLTTCVLVGAIATPIWLSRKSASVETFFAVVHCIVTFAAHLLSTKTALTPAIWDGSGVTTVDVFAKRFAVEALAACLLAWETAPSVSVKGIRPEVDLLAVDEALWGVGGLGPRGWHIQA